MDISDYEEGEYLEDEYEELEPTTSGKRTRGGGKAGGYQLKNVLKLPRATTYSTQALYDQIHASDIDLEPEYQRDVVWPESKQVGLIDSILRNFYIPPVIFVTHQHEDGAESKTCIDGKQRLTSIQRFIDGMIPHRDPLTGEKYWYKSSPTSQSGRSPGLLLPDKYKRLFANKQIVCIEYQDLPDSDEREIFQRVQLGMALTPAEKLQVLNTPMSAFVRTLQSQYLDADSPLGDDTLDWDRSRGGDFRCLAQALYVIAKYPAGSSIGAISQLEKWLHNPSSKAGARGKGKKKATDNDGDEDLSKDSTFIERIHATFRMLARLVGDASLRPSFLKPEWRVSPIEFVMMSLLVSVNKDNLSPREIAEKIGVMRVLVRKEHVDIRMNSRVAKTMFDYIRGLSSSTSVQMVDGGKSGSGIKRKREEDDGMTEQKSKKGKDREVAGDSRAPASASSINSALHTPSPALTRSPVLVPPPRPTLPDRPQAVKVAKMSIAPSYAPSPKAPPTGPAALRHV